MTLWGGRFEEAPDRILCITFTKAAAAEMANRIADRLALLATVSDEDLEDHLHTLLGRPPNGTERSRARRLFADVLDVPVEHRQLFLDTIRQMIIADGRVDENESINLELFEALLPI